MTAPASTSLKLIDADYQCRGCKGTGAWVSGGRCAACGGSGGVSREKAEKNAARRAERTADKRAAFEAANPELVAWLLAGNEPWALAKLEQWGSLFDDQTAKLNQKRLAPPTPERVKGTTPWTAGRQVVEGEIVSVKHYDGSGYGPYTGLTLRQDDGRAVWFKQPASLDNQSRWDETQKWIEIPGVQRGDRVRVSLGIEPKADDPTFAIGKRPTKAVIHTDTEN